LYHHAQINRISYIKKGKCKNLITIKRYLLSKPLAKSCQIGNLSRGSCELFLEMLVEGKMCIRRFSTYFHNQILKIHHQYFLMNFHVKPRKLNKKNLPKAEFWFFETEIWYA